MQQVGTEAAQRMVAYTLAEDAEQPGRFWVVQTCSRCGYAAPGAFYQLPRDTILMDVGWSRRSCSGKCFGSQRPHAQATDLDTDQ